MLSPRGGAGYSFSSTCNEKRSTLGRTKLYKNTEEFPRMAHTSRHKLQVPIIVSKLTPFIGEYYSVQKVYIIDVHNKNFRLEVITHSCRHENVTGARISTMVLVFVKMAMDLLIYLLTCLEDMSALHRGMSSKHT